MGGEGLGLLSAQAGLPQQIQTEGLSLIPQPSQPWQGLLEVCAGAEHRRDRASPRLQRIPQMIHHLFGGAQRGIGVDKAEEPRFEGRILQSPLHQRVAVKPTAQQVASCLG